MTLPALAGWECSRRRASLLGLVLFVLGSAVAPAVDAWRHASEADAAVQDSDLHECVVCRLASAPISPSPSPAALAAEGDEHRGLQFAPVQTHVRATLARLTPPTRAPPA